MALVYLSVGSNIDPQRHIQGGVDDLRRLFGELRFSPVYRCPAVGFEGAEFLNLVVALETQMTIPDLAQTLAEIEVAHGRDRGAVKFSSRTLDLDLLLYDDCEYNDGRTRLPRGEILTYAFVLRPLADLAPDLVHPQQGETLSALWAAFPHRAEQPLIATEIQF